MKKTFYATLVIIALVMLLSESASFGMQILISSLGLGLLYVSGRALSNIINEED